MSDGSLQSAGTRPWTAQQKSAISFSGGSLLVSAAAGSGKTSVLAERCAHLVCDAASPCDIDELLVVTFTEKAAGEMRSRIAQALRERQERGPTARLARQIALIDHAQISTLHAFCVRLLRENFQLAGLDPGFRVMDADEAALLRRDVARDLFERRYDDQSQRFSRMVDGYGNGNDRPLLEQLLHVHGLLTSVVNPAEWMELSRRRMKDVLAKPLEKTFLGHELIRSIARGIAALQSQCTEAMETTRRLGCGEYASYLSGVLGALGEWRVTLEARGIDALAEQTREVKFGKLSRISSGRPGKELAMGLVDAVRKAIAKAPWRQALRYSSAQWREGMTRVLPFAELFFELVEQFTAEYAQAKRALRSLDFADLERLSLQLLMDGGPAAPSSAARSQHRRFAHVLVDEYQDINEVQDTILTLVSRECLARKMPTNLFCVGDVKQSIYRFRLAEPRRFLERHATYREPGRHGRVIDLQANFRSRRPLLDALNHVFRALMCQDAVDIEYDRSHELVGGREFPADGENAFPGAPIDLHLLPRLGVGGEAEEPPEEAEETGKEPDRAEREAILVAREIRRMLGLDGTPPRRVADGAAMRPIECRDIVVLLRSMKHKAGQFASVLRQFGVPVHADSRSGYFESTEVRDMLALLQLLDNRRQDLPLAALLRSPLGGVPEVETAMAAVRVAYPEPIPFHAAAHRYKDEKNDSVASHLKAFYGRLDNWRLAAQRRPLAELIWDIYRDSGYLTYVSGLHNGPQRVQNLLYLHARAQQFGEFQSRGLSRFLRFLEQLEDEADLGQPSVASQAENVVQIMSIHASKGLEFPVVFVPDLGKAFNLSDCKGHILADRRGGLGMSVVDEERRCRYPSLASLLVKEQLRQQMIAEEMRILYVAATRAKEHLVMVGTCNPAAPDGWGLRWGGRSGRLPRETILGATTPLDWLGPVSAMPFGAGKLFNQTVYAPDDVAAWRAPGAQRESRPPRQLQVAALRPLASAAPLSARAGDAIARVGYAYPWNAYAQAPAALSVTARTHAADPRDAGQPAPSARLLPRPNFIERIAPSAADRGSATHLLLEHLNFAGAGTRADLAAQAAALVRRRVMTDAQAAQIDLEAVEWFLQTELGREMRRNPASIRRELPVNFAAPIVLPAGACASSQPLDRVMVRGRIDALVMDPATATLLDYKTDAISPAAVPERAAVYRPQLADYRSAIEAIAGRRVDAMYLAFLGPRVLYPVE